MKKEYLEWMIYESDIRHLILREQRPSYCSALVLSDGMLFHMILTFPPSLEHFPFSNNFIFYIPYTQGIHGIFESLVVQTLRLKCMQVDHLFP